METDTNNQQFRAQSSPDVSAGSKFGPKSRKRIILMVVFLLAVLAVVAVVTVIGVTVVCTYTGYSSSNYLFMKQIIKRVPKDHTKESFWARIAYNVFNMDRRLAFIAKLPLIIGGFFELG